MENMADRYICAHIHDEVVIECPMEVSVKTICEEMATAPSWAEGLPLKADGFESMFYRKD